MNSTNKKITNTLDEKSVSTTLFIPLFPKAMETKRKNPLIVDNKAVEITSQLHINFKAYVQKRSYHAAIVRTYIIDKCVKNFLRSNPFGTIINLGCGLDTRISRVDNGILKWFDIDLPSVIELRKRFFKESDRVRFIVKSILDFSWINDIEVKSNEPVLIIAEGLLPYFTEDEVKRLFTQLINHFPQSEMILTLVHKFLVGKQITPGVFFTWGLERVEEINRIDPRIRILDCWRVSDHFKNRQNPVMRFFSMVSSKGRNLNRILRLSFSEPKE